MKDYFSAPSSGVNNAGSGGRRLRLLFRFLYHSLKKLPVALLKVPKSCTLIGSVFQMLLKELKARPALLGFGSPISVKCVL
jgi:hypothetical protein